MCKKFVYILFFLCIASFKVNGAQKELTFVPPSYNQQMIDKVVLNWFEYENNPKLLFNRDIWWMKNKEIDDTITFQYKDLRMDAINGKLNQWFESPLGALAYVILIDQFSRNMFRNSPKAFEYDYLALKGAKEAISRGYDKRLLLTERVFLYMPLQHSENIDDQNQSVALFEQLSKDTPNELKATAQTYLDYAKEHQKVIKEFGRFPQRNKILSRKSTPAELEYLKSNPRF